MRGVLGGEREHHYMGRKWAVCRTGPKLTLQGAVEGEGTVQVVKVTEKEFEEGACGFDVVQVRQPPCRESAVKWQRTDSVQMTF